MVDGQIRPSRVTDPALLDALRSVPREKFVPRHLRDAAYADEDVPLGNGRFLAEPVVLARLIQAAKPGGEDIVLDIGSGTGYAAALLGRLAGSVVGIESDAEMARAADTLLHGLGIVNVAVLHHPALNGGYARQAPYNIILINGSVPAVPECILDQLAEGGRLATVLSKRGHMGSAVLVTRTGGSFAERVLFDAAMPVLRGFETPKAFVF